MKITRLSYKRNAPVRGALTKFEYHTVGLEADIGEEDDARLALENLKRMVAQELGVKPALAKKARPDRAILLDDDEDDEDDDDEYDDDEYDDEPRRGRRR